MPTSAWSVILAAGQGRRLASVTGGLPKQFWAPKGGRTLLEHTVDRMAHVSPPARMVTVVNQSQRAHAELIAARTSLGRIAYQAGDRGTAAGVLRGLIEVAAPPDALVVLTPSDHGVARSEVFLAGLRDAAREIRLGSTGIVLMAVEPESSSNDFGWIRPAHHDRPDRLRRVQAFVEKPSREAAADLLASGGVWSTMVVVARLQALYRLYAAHLPALNDVFRQARAVPADLREAFLADRYPQLPHTDFSRDLLGPAAGLFLYVWPREMGWTDLGTPDRLDAWLRGRSARPALRGALPVFTPVESIAS